MWLMHNNYETFPCLLPFSRYQPCRQPDFRSLDLGFGGYFGLLFKIYGSRFIPPAYWPIFKFRDDVTPAWEYSIWFWIENCVSWGSHPQSSASTQENNFALNKCPEFIDVMQLYSRNDLKVLITTSKTEINSENHFFMPKSQKASLDPGSTEMKPAFLQWGCRHGDPR